MRRRRIRIEPEVVRHFPSLSGLDLNQNVYMFTQDVHLAVMPIGGRTEKHKYFSVILDGENAESEKAKQLISSIGRDDSNDPKELLSDAVDEIAKRLAWEGVAVFEILRDEDGSIDLHGFTSKRLIRLPGYYLQVVPLPDWKLLKKRIVIVPASKIWYVEMPKILGGRSGYKRILASLERFENIGPRFWRKDMELGSPTINFDLQEYVRNAEIYFSRVTRSWGWNRRDWSQERSTEFFCFYKTITFHWAQAVLREHIIAELNHLLVRLQIKCRVNVVGLPTSTEIMQIRHSLQEGTISFGAAFDHVSM